MSNSLLSSEANIGAIALKNRFVLAAMGSNFAEPDGHCGERLQAYYEARAKGGAGLLILETSSVSWPAGAATPNTVGFSSDDFIPGLTQLAERVHKHGAKLAAQLNHSGKVAQEDTIAGRPVLVPSIPPRGGSDMMPLLTPAELGNFIKAAGPDGKGPRYHPMTAADIQQLVQDFADAARRSQQAGFDAVEIHAGHGYIISSFLSRSVNRREDNYGGSLDNRARLMVEIIAAVRAAVGPSMAILVRLDAKEYRIENGITPDDFVATARLAEQAGADAIDVSAYGNTAKAIAFTEAPLVHEPGGFIAFAKRAKQAVKIPVIAVGRIELEVAEKSLRNGDFDFVAMGRKLLADPDLPNKVAAGEADSVRPCIYCYICVSQIFINQPLCCAVNPEVGQEGRPQLIQTDRRPTDRSPKHKKMAVIGAGPGGMEAARLLAEQGHQVSLWEKDRDLGGTARIAALAYEPNGGLIKHLSHAIQRAGVDIRLNTPATVEALKAENPDHVIVATGAARRAPEIPGKHLRHVFDGEQMRGLLFGSDAQALKKLAPLPRLLVNTARHLQLLRHIPLLRFMSKIWMPFNKRIVIVGGGLVGLEMAEFLLERGRQVTVLEPGATLAPELSIVRRSRVIHLLREHGATLHTHASVSDITASQVSYQHQEQSASVEADQVVIALGAAPELNFAQRVSEAGMAVTAIGDCQNVGYIDGAMADARAAVLKLQQTPAQAPNPVTP